MNFIRSLKPGNFPILDSDRLSRLYSEYIDSEKVWEQYDAASNRELGFGKWKGSTIGAIYAKDRPYLVYLYEKSDFIKQTPVLRRQIELVLDLAYAAKERNPL